MKVGLFINTQFPEGVDVPAAVPAMVERVRATAPLRPARIGG